MQKCEHCLNYLLPPRRDNDIKLRPWVVTFYCLFVTKSYIDVLLLYLVFLTF